MKDALHDRHAFFLLSASVPLPFSYLLLASDFWLLLSAFVILPAGLKEPPSEPDDSP
jgi:hypothetical protein